MVVILPAAACRRSVHSTGVTPNTHEKAEPQGSSTQICFAILVSAVKPVLAVTWEETIIFLSMAAADPEKSFIPKSQKPGQRV